MMSIQPQEEKIARARVALQRSRELKRSRRAMGVDGIRQFVKDVDGDWLDNWTDITLSENIPKKNIPISCISLQMLLIETFLYFSILSLWCLSLPFLYKDLSTKTALQNH